ncbi:MAG TPA: hypothetical protein DCY48_01110 [Candidatus Magasanikbacteria bacterium]|nr:MAG: hypothetical protein A3I74_03580 [Candidatus Magasanikbacteria bacterium RIFCSPLOWO2_02_FULL_47_16]OGH80163.1 MAG: hypothetical protein A3C10_03165 [Candidatus Magasanikbacteria bacterium RIFCSPHIGHO2_02_FULL_48_18]HAZ28357.1 hypothetical protein [Candidatus Magasanikbacteria bacterium]
MNKHSFFLFSLLFLFGAGCVSGPIPPPTDEQATISAAIENHIIENTVLEGDIAVQNIRIDQSYAVASVTILDQILEPVSVYLKKESGDWQVIAGPTPSLSAEELETLGVPASLQKISEESNAPTGTDLVGSWQVVSGSGYEEITFMDDGSYQTFLYAKPFSDGTWIVDQEELILIASSGSELNETYTNLSFDGNTIKGINADGEMEWKKI